MEMMIVRPPVLGWIETKLSDDIISHLWDVISDPVCDVSNMLAGNITSSKKLKHSDRMWDEVLIPLINTYSTEFDNLGNSVPTSFPMPYKLDSWWVNYQNQTEFNPLHNHSGVYSFVIWMSIPTTYENQKQLPIAVSSHSNDISNFSFFYSNILGESRPYVYEMKPDCEGTMLFFPSRLPHIVYPYYNCDKQRISISGNITLGYEGFN